MVQLFLLNLYNSLETPCVACSVPVYLLIILVSQVRSLPSLRISPYITVLKSHLLLIALIANVLTIKLGECWKEICKYLFNTCICFGTVHTLGDFFPLASLVAWMVAKHCILNKYCVFLESTFQNHNGKCYCWKIVS